MNRVFAWPVGQEPLSRRLRRGAAPAAIYFVGSLLGGAALGLVLAVGAAAASSSVVEQALVCVALLALALQAFGTGRWLPQLRRQVPRQWQARGLFFAAAAWGIMLGFGLITWIHNAIFYVAIALAMAFADPRLAMVYGVLFGGVRGLVPLAHLTIMRNEVAACALETRIQHARRSRRMQLTYVAVGFLAVTSFVGANI